MREDCTGCEDATKRVALLERALEEQTERAEFYERAYLAQVEETEAIDDLSANILATLVEKEQEIAHLVKGEGST